MHRRSGDTRLVDRTARLVLRRTVARKAQVEKSPRVFGIEAAAL